MDKYNVLVYIILKMLKYFVGLKVELNCSDNHDNQLINFAMLIL